MKVTAFRIGLVLAPLAMLGLAAKLRRDATAKAYGTEGKGFAVPEDLYPFEHHFMDLPNGAKIHYIDEGPRDARHTLLFLHGNPTWSLLYHHIVEQLRSEYRCIAPDYPGFGLSTAPPDYTFRPRELSSTLEAFVDQLKPGRVVMMVQDWGGPIGLGLAGRRPELIEALVIGNTWAWPARPGGRKEAFSKLMGGPIGKFSARYFNGVARTLLYFGSSRGFSKKEKQMFLQPFKRGKNAAKPTAILPREIVKSARYLSEVEAGLKNVADRPVLILWGKEDWAFSPEDLKKFETNFPNHRTIFLEGANHFIQEDAPGRISGAIREFCQSLDTEPAPASDNSQAVDNQPTATTRGESARAARPGL